MSSAFKTFLLVALFSVLIPSTVSAQGIRSGSTEVTAKVGASNLKGVDNKDHVNFGFGLAYNFNKVVAVGFDYDNLPLGSESAGFSDGYDVFTINAKERLQLFGGTVRISLLHDKVAVPYVVVGGGGNVLSVTASAVGIGISSASESASQHGSYVGGGGGVSFYLTRHIGIRPEIRYEHQHLNSSVIEGEEVSGSGKNDVRGTASVFYQFGGHRG